MGELTKWPDVGVGRTPFRKNSTKIPLRSRDIPRVVKVTPETSLLGRRYIAIVADTA